jgi:glycosyltransferase involved in cell wall biosynthesis
MKICLLTDRPFFPPDSGRKRTLYSFCRLLHEDHHHEICVASFLDKNSNIDNVPDFIACFHALPNPGMIEKLWNAVISCLVLRRISLQSVLYRSGKAIQVLRRIVAEEKPEVLVFSMSRMGQYYVRFPKVRTIFDMDDCLSIRYKNMIDAGLLNGIFGRLSVGSSLFGKINNNQHISKILLKIEIYLLKREEKRIILGTGKTVLVNPIEAQQLSELYKTNKVVCIPNRVDTAYFKSADEALRCENSIVFHGLMSFPQNIYSVETFMKDVLPYIAEKIPEVKFIIIGAQVPSSLKQKENETVKFVGYVDDIFAWLSKTSVYVSWVWSGSGIKTKVLEAMSMALPVVTTSFGVLGIPLKDGNHCLMRDDPRSFADAVVDLLHDRNKAKTLGVNAREFIKKNYDAHQVVAQWNSLINETVYK